MKSIGNVWKDYMERKMNEEDDLDRHVEEDAIEGPEVCVGREKVLQTLNETKTVKDPGPSGVSLELIAASGGVEIQVIADICQSPKWIWNAS